MKQLMLPFLLLPVVGDHKMNLARSYNLLGQEVTTLVDAVQEAGFHHETWNASALSSGLYIYRITSTDESGHQNVQGKTMSLVK